MLNKHGVIERNSMLMLVLVIIVISIGGIVEILPLFIKDTTIEKVEGMRVRTPLEQAGFEIYMREGCYGCHSQQIRPLRDEVERYGHYSLAAESMYDFPFQWGSKRTGPDIARVGGKYSDEWHRAHMINPRDLVPESIMPGYPFMENREAKLENVQQNLKTLAYLAPYTDEMIKNAYNDAMAQATPDGDYDTDGIIERYGDNVNIRDFDGNPEIVSELDAIIAYLQTLGTFVDLKTYKAHE